MTLVRFYDLTLDNNLIVGGTSTFAGTATFNGSAAFNGSIVHPAGSWTPSLGGTATYTVQAGRYVKVGRVVFITFQLTVNAIGTGSHFTISGLPFAEGSGIAGNTPLHATHFATLGTSIVSLMPEVIAGGSSIQFYALTVAAQSAVGPADIFQNSASVTVSGCYEAAS